MRSSPTSFSAFIRKGRIISSSNATKSKRPPRVLALLGPRISETSFTPFDTERCSRGASSKVRYNRLIDLFLGITAYSLQNHLRTKIANYGQIEVDELYVGLDSSGAQYIVPVQAKGGTDKLGVIQTIQDTIFCRSSEKYADCIPRTVSAQFMSDRNIIAMFELSLDGDEVSIVREKHYRLVPSGDIGRADLEVYRRGD